jgi:NO-binding membrane sensor protein with MHYT domain
MNPFVQDKTTVVSLLIASVVACLAFANRARLRTEVVPEAIPRKERMRFLASPAAAHYTTQPSVIVRSMTTPPAAATRPLVITLFSTTTA